MSNVSPFPKKNIPAYMSVMGSMAVISIIMWAAYLYFKTGTFSISHFSDYSTELLFSFLMVMSGMMIMFTASLLNLRKMKKGWEAMAEGQKDVKIPDVWCPVLTSAKDAADQLMEKTTNAKA